MAKVATFGGLFMAETKRFCAERSVDLVGVRYGIPSVADKILLVVEVVDNPFV